MRPSAARCRFQWPYFTLTSGRADTGLTLAASFVCCGNALASLMAKQREEQQQRQQQEQRPAF